MLVNRWSPSVLFIWMLLALLDCLHDVMAQKLPAVRPIIHVIPNCPLSHAVNTTVVVKADVPIHAEVHCRHNRTFNMKEVDGVTHTLLATFSNVDSPSLCAFQKKTKTEVYVLPINVLWGDGEGEVLKFWHRTVITCGFDSHSFNTSSYKEISDLQLPLIENQQNLGEKTKVQFRMYLLDVLGNPMDGLPVGRKTQLKATMIPDNGEVGFRVTSCNAIGMALRKNSSYSILRGGCGDGKVFKKKDGFHTSGVDAFSPYFEAFRLMGSNLVTFACNFTVCKSNCDGNSCSVEPVSRRKRSVGEKTTGSDERKAQFRIYSSSVTVSSAAPRLSSMTLNQSDLVQSDVYADVSTDEDCGQVEITVVVFLVIMAVLLTCCLSCVTTSI